MIRTLAVNWAPILDCFKDDWKTAAETASEEVVMVAVCALCEFSLLDSQHSYSNLAFNALDNAVKRCYQKKGVF
jgi:hypothetical protein